MKKEKLSSYSDGHTIGLSAYIPSAPIFSDTTYIDGSEHATAARDSRTGVVTDKFDSVETAPILRTFADIIIPDTNVERGIKIDGVDHFMCRSANAMPVST